MKNKDLTYQVAIKEFHHDGESEVRIAERFYSGGRPAACPCGSGRDARMEAQRDALRHETEILASKKVNHATPSGMSFPGISLRDADVQACVKALTAAGIALDVGRIDIV